MTTAQVILGLVALSAGVGLGAGLLWLRVVAFGRERPKDCLACAAGFQPRGHECVMVVRGTAKMVEADDQIASGGSAFFCGVGIVFAGVILAMVIVHLALRGHSRGDR